LFKIRLVSTQTNLLLILAKAALAQARSNRSFIVLDKPTSGQSRDSPTSSKIGSAIGLPKEGRKPTSSTTLEEGGFYFTQLTKYLTVVKLI